MPEFKLSLTLRDHATRDQLASTLEALARMLRRPEVVSCGGSAGCVNHEPGTNGARGTIRESHGCGAKLGEWSGAPAWDPVLAQTRMEEAHERNTYGIDLSIGAAQHLIVVGDNGEPVIEDHNDPTHAELAARRYKRDARDSGAPCRVFLASEVR